MPKAREHKKTQVNLEVGSRGSRLFQVFSPHRAAVAADPAWTPFRQTEADSPAPSFATLEAIAATRPGPAWGVVCGRFAEATGLTGTQFTTAIQSNPGQDLYLCNPTPELEGAYANLWVQGNTVHPRLLEAAAAFFKANGWDEAALQELQPSRVFSSSQYLLGNEKFWSGYLGFGRAALNRARRKVPKRVQAWMSQPLKDPRDPEHPVTYWPLIIERLIPVHLKDAGQALKTLRIAPPLGERRLNPHLRRLREMKDVAHQTRSAWLASCWMHYRNSYFLNVIDRTWCNTHLPSLTRDSFDFH